MDLSLFILLLFLRIAHGQGNSTNSTTLVDPDVYPGASDSCLAVLTQQPQCNPLVYALYRGSFVFMDNDTVTDVCSESCFSALKAHAANVSSACAGVQYYDEPSSSYYPAEYLDIQAMAGFNTTCVQNDQQFCESYFQNTTSQNDCDYCWLKLKQTQLNVALDGIDNDTASAFASLTSSCKSTQFATTTRTPVVLTSPPIATATCSGSQYTVKSGDTMLSVSTSQKVATDTLLNRNGLSWNTTGFPTTGTLCIESQCTVHAVMMNETCSGIAATANISSAQLLSWNTNINPLCNNLANFVNGTLCVSNPLGTFTMPTNTLGGAQGIATTAAPRPTNAGTNTTSACRRYYEIAENDNCEIVTQKFGITLTDFYFLNPEINSTTCANLQLAVQYCIQPVGVIYTYPGYGASTTEIQPVSTTSLAFTPFSSRFASPTTAVTIPLANGTRTDCVAYKQVANSTSLDCWGWARMFGVSSEEMVLWNPSLEYGNGDPPAAYDYSCTLAPSSSYCIGLVYATETPAPTPTPPTPRAGGEITDCIDWFEAVQGYTCNDLLQDTGLTIADFFKMNPGVKSDCTGLALGTNYCISSPSVNGNNITTTISLPPQTTTTNPTTTSPGTGVTTPTPTQSGMVADCNKFHLVVKNEGCFDLAAANGIALADFYAWNPALKGDCSGLIPDVYVCVGRSSAATTTTSKPTTTAPGNGVTTPTPTQSGMATNCNKFHLVVKNEGCFDLAAANGIALADFYSWNPALKGDCSGLIPDVYVCIGLIGAAATTSKTSAQPTTTTPAAATPTPHQPNMVQNCTQFYLRQDGEFCSDIATKFGLTFAQFYQYNPDVGDSCQFLQAANYYCVKI